MRIHAVRLPTRVGIPLDAPPPRCMERDANPTPPTVSTPRNGVTELATPHGQSLPALSEFAGAPCAVKVACTVQERGDARNPSPFGRSNRVASALGRPDYGRTVCERETAHGRKCPCVLILAKGGASPPRGGAGKLRNTCRRGWQFKPEKDRRRNHDSSESEVSGEVAVTGVAPESPSPQLIA